VKGERSGLQTVIAATANAADEKLTAFMELESAIRACGKLC
jgi:hypothetical protein